MDPSTQSISSISGSMRDLDKDMILYLKDAVLTYVQSDDWEKDCVQIPEMEEAASTPSDNGEASIPAFPSAVSMNRLQLSGP